MPGEGKGSRKMTSKGWNGGGGGGEVLPEGIEKWDSTERVMEDECEMWCFFGGGGGGGGGMQHDLVESSCQGAFTSSTD